MTNQEIINELLRLKKQYNRPQGQCLNQMRKNQYICQVLSEAICLIKSLCDNQESKICIFCKKIIDENHSYQQLMGGSKIIGYICAEHDAWY